jgi:transposase InsO family protein
MPWKLPDAMEQRMEFALLALKKDRPFRTLCKSYGISPKTGYKWLERYQQNGRMGMADTSRRPHKSPAQLTEKVICELVRIKNLNAHWGPKKIRLIYERENGEAPSLSSVHRVLDKCGLVEKKVRRKANSVAQRLDGVPKAQASNEVWTTDFKGWWPIPGQKQHCQPLTVRDEHSRYILGLFALKSTNFIGARRCFEKLFEEYGLPQAIRSDNGHPFASMHAPLGLSRLSAWWLSLGIQLHRSRPGCPQDNGAHERMHRDIAREIEAYAKGNHRDHQVVFDLWRHDYNTIRPHEALGMKVPADFYRKSTRPYSKKPVEWIYPDHYLSRKTNSCGRIWIENQPLFLSQSLCGHRLGLKNMPNDKLEFYLANYCLGEIDLPSRSILWARPKNTTVLTS